MSLSLYPALHMPECPIHLYLHLLCPGCGATRAARALAHGHLAAAWHLNPFFVALLPFLFAYALTALFRLARRSPDPWPHISLPVQAALLTAGALFFVVRNL